MEYSVLENRSVREAEAAEFLGVKAATLQQWRFYGKGPRYVKFGRAVRYPVAELERFVEEHSVTPYRLEGGAA
jgi:predicted DNA-binding transcriptional regulator AlpA